MTTSAASGISTRLGKVGARFTSALTGGEHRGIARNMPVPEPLPAGEYELVNVDAGHFWMSLDDEVMRPFMQRAKTWEREEGRLLLSFVEPGCRFLDIGANVGYFSILIGSAAPGVSVDSVEPDPDNVRALRFNLWSNRIEATVWPVALDNRDRYLELSGNAHNRGDLRSNRITAPEPSLERSVEPPTSPIGNAQNGGRGWVVPAAAGDDLFEGRGFDLVKIDVQGWEFEVILGLDAVLLRSPGVRIVCEFWPAPLRANYREPADIIARYRQLGYRVRVSVGDDVIEMSDGEIVALCDSGGPDGQVNLLLER